MNRHIPLGIRTQVARLKLVLLLLVLGNSAAGAQVTIGDELVPGLGEYSLKPSRSAGSSVPYEILAFTGAPTEGERFDAANSQVAIQNGLRNSSYQTIVGSFNQTASYQLGFDNSVTTAAIGTVASSAITYQAGANHHATSVILGGSGNRAEMLQAGNTNTGQILIYGSSNTNVGLVQAGNTLTRSIAVVGSPGVNVLVVQR